MVHPSNIGCWLLVAILLLGSLLVYLFRAVVRHVSLFSTMKTLARSVRGTSLHWSSIGGTLDVMSADHPTAGSTGAAGTSCAAGTEHGSTD
jgi:hypothetical protein